MFRQRGQRCKTNKNNSNHKLSGVKVKNGWKYPFCGGPFLSHMHIIDIFSSRLWTFSHNFLLRSAKYLYHFDKKELIGKKSKIILTFPHVVVYSYRKRSK